MIDWRTHISHDDGFFIDLELSDWNKYYPSHFKIDRHSHSKPSFQISSEITDTERTKVLRKLYFLRWTEEIEELIAESLISVTYSNSKFSCTILPGAFSMRRKSLNLKTIKFSINFRNPRIFETLYISLCKLKTSRGYYVISP